MRDVHQAQRDADDQPRGDGIPPGVPQVGVESLEEMHQRQRDEKRGESDECEERIGHG